MLALLLTQIWHYRNVWQLLAVFLSSVCQLRRYKATQKVESFNHSYFGINKKEE